MTMTMNRTNPRLRLASAPGIGAGTYLSAVVESGRNLDTPALYLPGDPEPVPVTLRQLVSKVDGRAAALYQRGIRPRDPVAVLSGNAFDVATTYLALTRLGAVPALINAKLKPEILVRYLDRLRPAGLVTDAGLPGAGSGAGLPFVVTFAELTGGEPPAWYPFAHHRDDPVLITHTSGTTGVPKAVTATHGSLFAAVDYRLKLPVPSAYRRILSALPPTHNSAITLLSLALTHGVPVHLLSTQDADAVLDAIEAFRPTMVCGFAATYAGLAARELSVRELDSVTLWWNSGDSAHHAHIQKLVRHGSREVADTSGRRTERGSTFTDGLGSSEMGFSLFHREHKLGDEHKPRCVGRPYRFAEAAVLSPRGTALPTGEIGLLGVKSPTLTAGYWNDTATTYRSRLNGWWLTGDLVYQDAAGDFFHVDRASDAVRTSRGVVYTVLAEELLLQACPELADCTVVGRAAADGPRVQVLLQFAEPVAEFDENAWRNRIDAVLTANSMSTVDGVAVSDVPLGVTGKVTKRVVREERLGWVAEAEPMNIVGGHYA